MGGGGGGEVGGVGGVWVWVWVPAHIHSHHLMEIRRKERDADVINGGTHSYKYPTLFHSSIPQVTSVSESNISHTFSAAFSISRMHQRN